jgi:hypothetical protein
MKRMKRSVGICYGVNCGQFARPVFLLNQETFSCPACKLAGEVVHEGSRSENSSRIFKEVRVEFDYNPIEKCFAQTAVVRDESLWGRNNAFHFSTPLVKTAKQALKMAEGMLAALNQLSVTCDVDDLPRYSETRLNWDESGALFRSNCNHWGESLKDTPLARS